ncbi:MAG: hypothetical protein P4L74_06045 [Candidatus Doudnabacteria bacterium]|nr:hypothetical protein [Candidatus Doudnabacteria bacterium]
MAEGHHDTGHHETISHGSTNNGFFLNMFETLTTGVAGIVSEGMTNNALNFTTSLKDVVAPDNIKSSKRKGGGGGGGHAAPAHH